MTILLLDADAERRGLLACVLSTKPLLRIEQFGTVDEVLQWERGSRDVRVLVAAEETPRLGRLLTMLESSEIKTLMLGYRVAETGLVCDVFLNNPQCFAAQIYERIRCLCARKSGPKRVETKMMEERKTA
jgi:hypothetical protein